MFGCPIQVREREFFIQIICREQRLFRAPDVLNPFFPFRCPVLSQPNTIIISLACTHAGGTLTHQESREIDSDRQRAHQMLKRMEVCLSCFPPPPEHLNDSRSSQRLCAEACTCAPRGISGFLTAGGGILRTPVALLAAQICACGGQRYKHNQKHNFLYNCRCFGRKSSKQRRTSSCWKFLEMCVSHSQT